MEGSVHSFGLLGMEYDHLTEAERERLYYLCRDAKSEKEVRSILRSTTGVLLYPWVLGVSLLPLGYRYCSGMYW